MNDYRHEKKKKKNVGCLGSGLLLYQPPPGLSGDRGDRGRGLGGVGAVSLDLVDEGLYCGELLSEVAEVSLEGVELLVEVVESLGERLDPGGRRGMEGREGEVHSVADGVIRGRG